MSKRKPKTMATAAVAALEVAAFVLLAGIAVAQQRLPAAGGELSAPQAPSQSASSPSAKTQPATAPASASRPASGSASATQPASRPLTASESLRQAQVRVAKMDIVLLEVALDSFQVDCGRNPATAEGLKALVEKPAGELKGWAGPYHKALPKDPWGNAYVYRCPGLHNTAAFDLYSFGPDGNEGGGDDIENWSIK
jgi:general secretion pathway protein G